MAFSRASANVCPGERCRPIEELGDAARPSLRHSLQSHIMSLPFPFTGATGTALSRLPQPLSFLSDELFLLLIFQNVWGHNFQFCVNLWLFPMNLVQIVERQSCLHETRLFQLSIDPFSSSLLHAHQGLFPSLVEHRCATPRSASRRNQYLCPVKELITCATSLPVYMGEGPFYS